MKPIVKWAGGKTQLLKELLPLIPEYDTYYEPFFGGGALFFASESNKAVINDLNKQLMNVYIQIRDNLPLLEKKLDILQENHTEDVNYYYNLRNKYNEKINNLDVENAALFIYLNKAGFNGIYRLNTKGLFNVPSSKKKKVSLYDKDNLLSISKHLKSTKIFSKDFEEVCSTAKENDFIFFDSPYYNTFDTYQAGGFSESDHIRLFNLYKSLSENGVKCLLTNSNEAFIKNLYKDYDIKVIDVKRMINRNGNDRTGQEVLIKNY